MKTNFLFPNYFKKIGWAILIPILLIDLYSWFGGHIPVLNTTVLSVNIPNGFQFIQNDIVDEILIKLTIIATIFAACSKEKIEDEFISKIRLESLLWAVYINYGLLIIDTILFYETDFLNIMIYNMFTLLLLFLLRFNYVLYKSKHLNA